jgi:elongation factor P--(R)-beta-lysine ligase
MWWEPGIFERKRPFLEKRMKLIKAIRAHFDDQGFWEVETPILQVSPVMDTHILALKTDLKGVDKQYDKTLYLHTSPEFAMKKLMVAGISDLYQICHVFRNADHSRLHSREFTMIEWYRAGADYRKIMQDCMDLLRRCAQAVEIKTYTHRDKSCDPFRDWQVISVAEAFDHYAGIDLIKWLEDRDGFRAAISAKGIHTAEDDRWDDLFFRVMGEKIEPHLGMAFPCVLYDYPVSMASLSRPKPEDPRFAERFELYVCGIEVANAFGELTDAKIQRDRFREELAFKEQIYGERYPVDEDFIAALEYGLPESSGIALGIDRLAMLAAGVGELEDVFWTPRP